MRKWWKDALRRKTRSTSNRRTHQCRVLGFENLEDRRLLTTTLTPVQPVFVQDGPAPITNPVSTPANDVPKSTIGSVEAVAIDTPLNSSGGTVFAGTVNGGVWETTNYTNTSAGPTWTPITSQDNIILTTSGTAAAAPASATPTSGLDGSLSISALAVDTSNALPGGLTPGSTLVAATGSYSDVGLNGTGPAGVISGVWEDLSVGSTITTNPVWYQVAGIPVKNYSSVAVGSDSTLSGTLTQYIMASDNGGAQYFTPLTLDTNTVGGLYESTMTYANGVPTYTAFTPSTPLPAGAVTDVVEDPSTPSTYYAAVIGTNAGVYRSQTNNNVNGQPVSNGEDGNTWVEIASIADLPELSGALNIQLAAGKNNTLYVGIVNQYDQLGNVYFTTNDSSNLASTAAANQGVKWTAMGVPGTADGGINTYSLGELNFAIAVDPNNSTQIYVGGDYAPPSSSTGTWPNTSGSAEDTGVVFRGNVSGTSTTWTNLVGNGGDDSSPPGGTRVLKVLPTEELVEGNDGGIYDRVSPTGSGLWVSHNGLIPTTPSTPSNGISATEYYSVAYNPLSNSVIGGTQNLGVTEQTAQNADQYNTVSVSNPNESVTPITNLTTVSPIGISGGQVAVAADPGTSNDILYASNDYFNDFFTQNLTATMTTPPPTSTPTMLVDGSNGQTLYQVEDNLGTGPTFSFQTPIVANADAVAGNKWLVVGSDYVYESFDGGNTWTAIQGLSGTGSTAVPVNGVGPVTSMAYGGVYQGNDQGSQYVLWVGSSGSYGLYLRVLQAPATGNGGTYLNPTNVLVPQTAYPGGSPVGIVENPSNWTNTYVADGTNVYLAQVPFNGTNTTGNTKFTSLSGPGGGFKISGITYVPDASAAYDLIVVSGWNAGSATNTGVYELEVNKTTGLAYSGATSTMVGAPASGVQTGITGQEPQLPHVPVTAITYNATADVLVVTTEGLGVWTLPSFTKSATGYTMSVTGTGNGTTADVQFVDSTTQPGYFYVLMNGVPDTLTANPAVSPAPAWPLSISIIQQTNVDTTATNNILDFDFNSTYSGGYTVANPPVNPIPSGRFVDASAGTTNTIQAEDNTSTISLSGSAGGGTLSLGNSPTTITLQTALTGASLTGGSANTNFILNSWSVPATLNGNGGFGTLYYTSNNNSAVTYVLSPTSLTQTVSGTLLNATLTLTSIMAANLIGGSGSNTFDITQWLGSGSIVGGSGSVAGTVNTLVDTTTVATSYIYYSDNSISVGSPSNNAMYRPLIALGNFQTIDLASSAANVNYFDQGWSGTSNLTGGTGNGNAVLIGSNQLNTTFTLTDSTITTGSTAIVNILGNIQWYNIFGGPGTNFYNVSGFDLSANLVAGGSGNVLMANEKNNMTLSNSQFLVGSNGSSGSFNLYGITGAVLDTVAGIHTVTINSWSGGFNLNAGSGADTFVLGGNATTGTLSGMGPATIEGGGGSTITLNDIGTTGNGYTGSSGYWYDMFNNSVEPDGETPRNWYGVTFDSNVTSITVNGASSNAAKYLVGPLTTTTFNINGNSGNDFLGVLFYGTQSQILTDSPDPSDPTKENGAWTFNSASQPVEQKPINFTGINSFNGVTPLVVSGGASSSNASEPLVRIYDASTGKFVDQWDAYPTSFQGGVQVAVGQFLPASPSTYYVVTAPGPGTPDLVKVWTETGQLVTQFYAFGPSYTGGVNVAVGDVTGDGIPDIVVSEQSGGTAVWVYNGASLNTSSPNLTVVTAFSAYGKSYTGGASIAVAPMKPGATYSDIVTVPYSAAPAQVLVFDGSQVSHGGAFYPVDSYLALPASYTLGATVALGDVLGNGQTDIVVAAGINGSSEIVVTNGASAMTGTSNPSKVTTFYAYPTPGASTPTYTGTAEAPVRVTLKDILGDGRMEIFTSQGTGGSANGGINILWGFSGQEIAHLAINSASQGGLSLG